MTVNITATITDTTGDAVVGARVNAKLFVPDVLSDFVVPEDSNVTGTTDANGQAVLALWPNSSNTDINTYYRVRAWDPATKAKIMDVCAYVDTAANLEDIAYNCRTASDDAGGTSESAALASHIANTGDPHSAAGYLKGYSDEDGNTWAGYGALAAFTPFGEDGITAFGYNALGANVDGNDNSAFGSASLSNNVNGVLNTACGSLSLLSNVDGVANSAFGGFALEGNVDGTQNSAFGVGALSSGVSAYNNSGFGYGALTANVSGINNTAVGHQSLYTLNGLNNCSGIGAGASVTGSNQVQLGNSSTTTYVYGTVQNRSDERDKADIKDTALGLEFINALRPVDYRFDMREDYRPDIPGPISDGATDEEKAAHEDAMTTWREASKLSNITPDGSRKRSRFHHGLIAQEVRSAMEAIGVDFGGFQDHSINGGDDVMSIGYDELIAPLIKAVQELAARVADLEAGK